MFAGETAATPAVTSQIVGFGTAESGTKLYPTWGNSFVSITASKPGMLRLGDLELVGSTWGRDWLNFINPQTCVIDSSKDVTYYSKAEAIADGGTAEDAEWEDQFEACKDDVEYPFGTGFLCNFANTGISMIYKGEVNVNTEISTIDCTGKSYPFISNLYPGNLTFGDVKLENSTWGRDWVNFVNPAKGSVDSTRDITYYSEAEAIADGGTAEDAEWEDQFEACKDDVPLKMGEGFLCNFASSSVKVIFPTYNPNVQ